MKEDEIALELTTLVLNINPGYNQDIFDRCPLLYEYMLYVECVRKHSKSLPLEKAVELAVEECISKNILRDFLKKNRVEVIEMSIFEYDEELHKKMFRQEGYDEGIEKGRTEGREEGIKAFILDKREDRVLEDIIIEKLQRRFKLERETALEYCKRF